MKVYYDWEFEENGITITPITLGMVSENNNVLYLYNSNYNAQLAPDWIRENVIKNLASHTDSGLTMLPNPIGIKGFAGAILEYIGSLGADSIELVADYASYDFVCLCQRFGAMIDMPQQLPWFTLDIKQWEEDLQAKPPEQISIPHNALNDAYYCKYKHEWLIENYDHPAWVSQLRKQKFKVVDLI